MSQKQQSMLQAMITQMVASSSQRPKTQPQRFNPRAPGQIVPGSTTDLILQALKEAPGFLTHAQIVWRTQRNTRAVAWSLAALMRLDLIQSIPDLASNSRYRRYRFKREQQHAAAD